MGRTGSGVRTVHSLLAMAATACAACHPAPPMEVAPVVAGSAAAAAPPAATPSDVAPSLPPPARHALDAPPTGIPHPIDINFENKMHFIGYALEPESPPPGQAVRITLWWRCDDALDDDGWTLSTYLRERSAVVAGLPDADNGPTPSPADARLVGPGRWEKGRFYADERSYLVPAHAEGSVWLLAIIWKDATRLRVIAGPNDGANRAIAVQLPMPTKEMDGGASDAATAGPRTTTAPPPPAPVPMASIPGGSYVFTDSKQRVTVAPFSLDVTEVTAEAYAVCVARGTCTPALTLLDGTGNQPGKERHPINYVDWSQASAYCAAAGKRLPTAAEWEWAARGGARASAYPWGEAPPLDQACWNRSKLGLQEGTCPVASFPAGNFGLFDMGGNVWEWTATIRSDGVLGLACGGAWDSGGPPQLHAECRSWLAPKNRADYLGFRCAR